MGRMRARFTGAVVAVAMCCATGVAGAQGPGADSTATADAYAANRGFRIVETKDGEVRFRLFTYVRYLNQKGLDATSTDSFGNTSEIDRRQDIQFQKLTLNFQGWFMDPKFRYLAYAWTSNTNQGLSASVVLGGNLNYLLDPRFTFGGGIDALPGVRATEGNFPFWLTMDNRLVADEYFRPSYTMGIWAAGTVAERLRYKAMLGNNLSQLGVDAGQLDANLNTFSGMLVWMPTTGEFGTGGGFGDMDGHAKVATRVGAHYTRSEEDRQSQPTSADFENVTIRISDGNPIFKADLFGPGITISDATYRMFSADAGVKYRGFSLEGEYFSRRVDDLMGPLVDTLPFDHLVDDGFQLQASAMIVPKTLQAYAGVSQVYGDYGDPSDFRLGVNWFPYGNHVVRWNTEYLHTDHSPVGGLSLPTQVGGTGDIVYSSLMVNF